jgi:peroxiredoxin
MDMAIEVGDRIPSAKLRHKTADGVKDITTDEIFRGKKVALFGLPGAFTPTCSAKHLPGYVAEADALRRKGVDTIACLAVNDAFVMGAWSEANGVGSKILMLADGNADLTRALGLEMDGSGFGMGLRCKRFSALVEDGTVKTLHVEAPGKFEVSDAATLLKDLG